MPAAIDPAATTILKRATDRLESLQQFSVNAHVTLEDPIDSGDRADFDMHTRVTIRRPNKLRSERVGDLLNQVFFHDGKLLTLYNPDDKVYAPVAAPATIDATIHFASEKLGSKFPPPTRSTRTPTRS